MKKIYHFLASIHFALILIATLSFAVICGTLLESYFDSHALASLFTYENPAFYALLIGFFINILFSALRRWPFKKQHIPFLITHLSLLMIIAGVFFKNLVGLQGNMGISEWSGSNTVFIPKHYTVNIKSRENEKQVFLQRSLFGGMKKGILKNADHESDLSLNLVEFYPNASEYFESWIKEESGSIAGLAPFNVISEDEALAHNTIHPAALVRFGQALAPVTEIYAFNKCNTTNVLERIILDNTTFTITGKKQSGAYSLGELIKHGCKIDNYKITAAYHHPVLTLSIASNSGVYQEPLSLDLHESTGLLHAPLLPLTIELSTKPKLIITERSNHDSTFFAISPSCRLFEDIFSSNKPDTLYVYDKGFGGYSYQYTVPYSSFEASGKERRQAALFQLGRELKQIMKNDPELSPPLQIVHAACQSADIDFVDTLLQWLYACDHENSFYMTLSEAAAVQLDLMLQHVDPKAIDRSCFWAAQALLPFQDALSKGQSPLPLLEKLSLPGIVDFNGKAIFSWSEMGELFHKISAQLHKASGYLPLPNAACIQENKAAALNIFFKLYGLTADDLSKNCELNEDSLKEFYAASITENALTDLFPAFKHMDQQARIKMLNTLDEEHPTVLAVYELIEKAYAITGNTSAVSKKEMENYLKSYTPQLLPLFDKDARRWLAEALTSPPVVLETALQLRHEPKALHAVLEENLPCILLKAERNHETEYISLQYDQSSSGLYWPIFGGDYQLRFQSEQRKIPCHLRLRDARQINYPGSSQAMSYESDLLVDAGGRTIEKTLSMNNVYESDEGYRFYLSNIHPMDESAVQKAHIVVNYDPVKYWLTYPGGALLALGIIGLFWFKPYRR